MHLIVKHINISPTYIMLIASQIALKVYFHLLIIKRDLILFLNIEFDIDEDF